MVSKQSGTFVFTGTTRDEELARELEEHVADDEDRLESDVVREAVREYLGVE